MIVLLYGFLMMETLVVWANALPGAWLLTCVATLGLWWIHCWLRPQPSTQLATYQELQRLYGPDWDVIVSQEEYDRVNQRVRLALQLRDVRPTLASFGLSLSPTYLLLVFLLRLPGSVIVQIATAHGLGVLIGSIPLAIILYRRQRAAAGKARPQTPLSPVPLKHKGHYTLGDDGELIERDPDAASDMNSSGAG